MRRVPGEVGDTPKLCIGGVGSKSWQKKYLIHLLQVRIRTSVRITTEKTFNQKARNEFIINYQHEIILRFQHQYNAKIWMPSSTP